MAQGRWLESSDTDYYYGNAAASSGVALSRTGTEATARLASFDSGALLPEVIKLNLDAWGYDAGGSGSQKRATFSVTVAGGDDRDAFSSIKTYTFYDPSEGTNPGNALVKTFTFDNPYQFWYIKVKITVGGYFTTEQDDTVYGKIEMNNMVRTAYKTKTMVHGSGLQVMSGPDQYMRLGRNQNLIYGDLAVSGSVEAGGTGYFSSNLTVGDDSANTAYPLYVVGDLAATGNIIAYVSSDERLKTHITQLEDSLKKLKRLNAVDFLWKNHSKGWGKKTPQDIGLLAQEVEKEFPSLVGEMADGYKGIRYDRMVPILVDSIKTQDKKIEKLESLVEKLINELEEE
jgi:hypothetical protein